MSMIAAFLSSLLFSFLCASAADAAHMADFFAVTRGGRNPRISIVAKAGGVDDKKSQRGITLNKNVANFLAGGMAGTFSATVTLPLEVVKTQMQASTGSKNIIKVVNNVYSQTGLLGFFKGLRPMVGGILPTRALYFSTYKATKKSLQEKMQVDGPLNHLCSAFSAGIVANTIMNPWWMVKTRFQILADASVGQKQFSTYGQMIKSIYKEEGLSGFWKGTIASYVGCFEGAIQWMTYEKLKTVLQERADGRAEELAALENPRGFRKGHVTGLITSTELMFAGAIAKAGAILATYPHEVVRTRMREQATNGVFKYTGFMNTLTTIATEEGAAGLYGGLWIHLGRSVPNAALMFTSFELISRYLDRHDDGDGISVSLPSLGSAASKNRKAMSER
jgi:solute carrier family 25 protein 33/36